MTMLLFAVERQHPVSMLAGLDRIAEPKIGDRGGKVPGDQEIRVAEGLGSAHQLRDPAQRFGNSSPCQHVEEQSPEYRQEGIVAAKRVRRPQRGMQAVPDLLRLPASERHPRRAQPRAQIQLAAVALRRARQRRDQLQALVQVRDRLDEGQMPERQAARLLP